MSRAGARTRALAAFLVAAFVIPAQAQEPGRRPVEPRPRMRQAEEGLRE